MPEPYSIQNPNPTSEISVADYRTLLKSYSFPELLNELQRNRWLLEHLQVDPIDYAGRISACLDAMQTPRTKELYEVR